MCTDIDRIAELAKEDPKRQFYSIAHLITVEKLYEAFRSLRKDASAGVDGVKYAEYETNAEENVRQLHRRLVEGKYQVQPLRRVYIPKENGQQRPISTVKPRMKGEAYEIRFADDAILCFQNKEDAEKVLSVLPKRFEKYGLTLHPEKTRLIEFGRYAARNAKQRGKKPETFDFLGFKHICARSRKGKFAVHGRTLAKRLRRGLKAITGWCKQHRHEPVAGTSRVWMSINTSSACFWFV